jgi:hypothetical protein
MEMGDTLEGSGTVNCLRCRHYVITWQPAQPYGCRAHGFKSRKNPALVVFESSGLQCQLFQPKFERSR